ncbi:MAG: PRC-barrel domain-containing protein [Sphingobacteriales bacterium]
MATDEKTTHRLEELHGSGFEIVDGQPDILGWDVKARSGKKVGEVKDLLFEPRSRKVRYLVIDLDDNELNLEEGRNVLVPIGIAELYTKSDHRRDHDVDPAYEAYDPAEDGNVVFLPEINAVQLDALPLYEKNHLSPHVEMAIRKILEPGGSRYDEDEFYRHENFNDDRFYHHGHHQHHRVK